MSTRRIRFSLVACLIVPLALLGTLGGCPTLDPTDGGTTDGGTTDGGTTDGGTTDTARMRINFDATGGNYAVATDDQGNQYSFRAYEDADGDEILTEANIRTADGRELKLSLDADGRPVNVRLSDNTAADLVYDGDNVDIRLTDADGNVIDEAQGVKADSQKEAVRARRLLNRTKASARCQEMSTSLQTLQQGLESCEEVVESITDETTNPDSPLAGNDELTERMQAISSIASETDIEEVDERDELGEEVDIDEVPDTIRDLAGKTFILFDAEGFCIEFTDIANRLTFDNNGILQNEYDRQLVFPDYSGRDGITINYASLTTVNLTPDEEDVNLYVTPVFTGTQLDEDGQITIERRFQADLEFQVEILEGVPTTATAQQLFDVAFINGQLSEDGGLLELDLVLVDLEEDNPVGTFGRLRYHDQNVRQPERLFPCEIDPQDQELLEENPEYGLECPGVAEVGTSFEVTFNLGEDDPDLYDYDWYVDGLAFVEAADGPTAAITPTDSGIVEVTLLLHDLTDNPEPLGVFRCTIDVGVPEGEEDDVVLPEEDELALMYWEEMEVEVPREIWVEGTLLSELWYSEFYVIGDWFGYYVESPFAPRTEITFYSAGDYIVVFTGWLADGSYVEIAAEVTVVEQGESDYEGDELDGEDDSDGEDDGDGEEPDEELDFEGEFDGGFYEGVNTFDFVVDVDGEVTGNSYWEGSTLPVTLTGWVDASGYLYMEDNLDIYGLDITIYTGQFSELIGGFDGSGYTGTTSNYLGDWEALPSTDVGDDGLDGDEDDEDDEDGEDGDGEDGEDGDGELA